MTDVGVPEIIQKISTVAGDHFNSPGLVLNPQSIAADVDGWDSIGHIQFIMRLEEEFRIRFKSAEIAGFKNVGELATRIATHLK